MFKIMKIKFKIICDFHDLLIVFAECLETKKLNLFL
jgi:hypothetical protein